MKTAGAPFKPKILLSGYYGFHNLGDEAILVALVQGIRTRMPDADVVVLSSSPQHTARQLGVRAVDRWSVGSVWRELSGAALLVSGGGSLLQDVTGLGSVPYYLGVMTMARLRGVPAMMLGQGVGPLNHWLSRRMVGWTLSCLDAVTVRDSGSASLLRACGLAEERLEVTADPVLAMAPTWTEHLQGVWANLGLDPALPIIGVSLRPWGSWTERQLKSFSAVLAQYAHQWQAQVVLIPFHRPDDDGLLRELEACLLARPEGDRPVVATVDSELTPPEMLALLQRMDLILGMRLHSLIMAAAVQRPALGLSYDPKVTAFCSAVGYPTVPAIDDLQNSEQFARLLARVWSERGDQSAHLGQTVAFWQQKATRNLDILQSLVQQK